MADVREVNYTRKGIGSSYLFRIDDTCVCFFFISLTFRNKICFKKCTIISFKEKVLLIKFEQLWEKIAGDRCDEDGQFRPLHQPLLSAQLLCTRKTIFSPPISNFKDYSDRFVLLSLTAESRISFETSWKYHRNVPSYFKMLRNHFSSKIFAVYSIFIGQ